MRKRLIKLLGALFVIALISQAGAAIFLCEGALHLRHKPLTAARRAQAASDAEILDAKREDVDLTSFDGACLVAWFFRPEKGDSNVVTFFT